MQFVCNFQFMFFKITRCFLIFLVFISFEKLQSQTTTVPPSLEATGNQPYCPLNEIPIVETFSISNPDNVIINKIFIQISEGYENGKDILKYIGSNPNIAAKSFNVVEGKLELEWVGSSTPNDAELITAVKNVVFQNNTAPIIDSKTFSITIGQANYLPSTGHYYEFVSSVGITWQQAKVAAEARNYYGLQGYLVTITTKDEAQLCGEQASGAGWIGGSDTALEGTWRWMTGPEAGGTFWKGGIYGTTIGTDYPYANWNVGEPNNLGDEDFAHVTFGVGRKGSWNDLPNGGSTGNYYPQGYLVEYGGMPGEPILNISASTKIYSSTIDTAIDGENCGPGSVNLNAIPSFGTVLWFDVPNGGTSIGKGTNFLTPSISTTTTFYAVASYDGVCDTGERIPIIATIKEIPTIINVKNDTICEFGTGILTAEASIGVVNWYASATGGVSIGTGTSFTTPVINNTTTFYAVASYDGICDTNVRTPVTVIVQHIDAPTAPSKQTFCDIENATMANLAITGTDIQWYLTATGGVPLNASTALQNNTTYYASQTINGCEGSNRFPVNVLIYETVTPLPQNQIPLLEVCDNATDGDDTNGFTIFDLTVNNSILLNGKNATDFTFFYYTDASQTQLISNPSSFQNTIKNGQTIYVNIVNNIDNSCATSNSFNIQVNALPTITSEVNLKNCDEDGTPDGKTDFNLNEANEIISNGDNSLTISYYLTSTDATLGINAINPSPFNNSIATSVYARAENQFGCFRIATVILEVSTTSFPPNFNYEISQCEIDNNNDGFSEFDLTEATQYFLSILPPQNLSVEYYRNVTDAQLEQNEILPQSAYVNEVAYSQILYVRVESLDNGDCFGIGPHLTLTVNPRPEVEIQQEEVFCLNLPPITLSPKNINGNYTYKWLDSNGTEISNQPTLTITSGGDYTIIATSNLGCESFPQTVQVIESENPIITQNDVDITDDSSNNTIIINNQNNNLGIGDYEFALDNSAGPFQTSNVFEDVLPGIHTIFVQDIYGCGNTSLEVSVIGFPKFFTPNGDGFNDTWKVLGVNSDFYPTSLIYIFDRFGKLITQVNPTGEGWNGEFNGEQLPSSDYWFSVQLIDENGNIREKRGHFSLVRR